MKPASLVGFFLLIPVVLALAVVPAALQASPANSAPVRAIGTPAFSVYLPIIMKSHSGPAHLAYGANVAERSHAYYLQQMGFGWAKGFVEWRNADLGSGSYNWADLDNQAQAFASYGRKMLFRINGPPPSDVGNPPLSSSDLSRFQAFVQAAAAHLKSRGVDPVALEIWNEPNLDYEWGGRAPSAAEYTALLKAGYNGAKAADPNAIVVSAGLATTGGTVSGLTAAEQMSAQAYFRAAAVAGDLAFIQGMYDAGARGFFSALGSHPYGGPYPPNQDPTTASGGMAFRRAEQQYAVMQGNGDGATPVWATEFGWLVNTTCDLGYHNWFKVTEQQQSDYLVGAYQYADANWPWMAGMFLFNLDFGTVYWYAYCDTMRWFSIIYRENPQVDPNTPLLFRPAYAALTNMAKRPAF
ncbi:MAG: hypothetical protein AB1566_13990 [Chloroflexota bacterium]